MKAKILDEVLDFINSLSEDVAARILAGLKCLELNQTGGLVIKQLKGKVKELIIKQYRVIFFMINDTLYVIDIFKKQSQKTPHRVIAKAEKMYKMISGQK